MHVVGIVTPLLGKPNPTLRVGPRGVVPVYRSFSIPPEELVLLSPQANRTAVSKSPIPLEIRHTTVADAAEMWRLVHDCEVLDTNSCYAYLLICRDFAATSLVAVSEGKLLGFVSAYIPPERPDTVFVWQIGIAGTARRMGIGKSLLRALLRTRACRPVQFLEATVTPSNTASARLFRSLADELPAGFEVLRGFDSSDFGPVENELKSHEPENLVRIGPIEEQP